MENEIKNDNQNPVSEPASIQPAVVGGNSGPSHFYLLVALFLGIIIASLLVFRYAESKRAAYGQGQSPAAESVQKERELAPTVSTEKQSLRTDDAPKTVAAKTAAPASAYEMADIKMAGKTFSAEIADTFSLRESGLSNRASIASDKAMLFIFETDDNHLFWMKDMNFAIDMIWLDSNKKVVHIAKKAAPESYPQTFGQSKNSRYVIEVKSGIADSIGLQVGDIVSF